jgi:hypothetical protein
MFKLQYTQLVYYMITGHFPHFKYILAFAPCCVLNHMNFNYVSNKLLNILHIKNFSNRIHSPKQCACYVSCIHFMHWGNWRNLIVPSCKQNLHLMLQTKIKLIGLQVLMTVILKGSSLWNAILCRPVKVNCCFKETYHFHNQSWRVRKARDKHEEGCEQTMKMEEVYSSK